MEILNLNSNQKKPQEVVKISNGQFYDGNIRTVKQRAHKFNAIAISHLNGNINSSNIPVPNKSIGSHVHSMHAMAKINNKNCENAKKNSEINNNPKQDSNNNNHNIKINIVNKYTNKNTTHVATKNINTENEKIISNLSDSMLKSDDQNNMNISNAINGGNTEINNTTRVLLNTNDVKLKINQLNPPNKIKPSTNILTSTSWNSSGFIRVYCGPDRSEISIEDPNRMVNVYATSTTVEVVKDMGLPADYTIWCQIGKKTRRLDESEHPLLIQEEFLKKIGYLDESRRSRLGIDLDLKYLIRFHIGPTDHSLCRGALKCGNVELLKGLVFPQWRRRTIAIIGTKLILYPANLSLMPSTFELSGSEIFEHSPCYNRLIIKIVPKISDSLNNTTENLIRNKSVECINSSTSSSSSSPNSNLSSLGGHHNSNLSVCSQSSEVVLFLGFEESWERDLWSSWLMEVIL